MIQRFGGALNLNIHFHALVLDGVYTSAHAFARPQFESLPPPSREDVEKVLSDFRRRLRSLFERRWCMDRSEPSARSRVGGQARMDA